MQHKNSAFLCGFRVEPGLIFLTVPVQSALSPLPDSLRSSSKPSPWSQRNLRRWVVHCKNINVDLHYRDLLFAILSHYTAVVVQFITVTLLLNTVNSHWKGAGNGWSQFSHNCLCLHYSDLLYLDINCNSVASTVICLHCMHKLCVSIFFYCFDGLLLFSYLFILIMFIFKIIFDNYQS